MAVQKSAGRNWHNLDNPITRERLEKHLRYQFEVHRSSLELLPIDKAFNKFHELLTEALNSHLPEKYCTQKRTKIGLIKRLKTKKLNAEFSTRNAITIENQSQSVFLKSISENDVMYAINNCKNKFSLDCYNLKYFFIKKVSDCLAAPLQLLFNRCIELGQYPESVKIAKVIPFFKNGNKDDPSNFRPISLLPIIGKFFERIIFD